MILVFFFLLTICRAPSIFHKGSLLIDGDVTTPQITVTKKQDGSAAMLFTDLLETKNLKCKNLHLNADIEVKRLKTRVIRPLSSDSVTIKGSVKITGEVTWSEEELINCTRPEITKGPALDQDVPRKVIPPKEISLLQVERSLFKNVSQWHDLDNSILEGNWQAKTSEGVLIPTRVMNLFGSKVYGGSIAQNLFNKIENLPEHTHIRVQANFYFLSPVWNGEAALIRADGRLMWMDKHNWPELKNVTSCELLKEEKEQLWTTPIDFVLRHNRSNLELSLEANVDIQEFLNCPSFSPTHPLQNSPVYGVSDIHISIR
eukprot:TRINITY_DN5959_c0_g1_i2.p1 TRINITY_DN5959_c0_g1~~TRINITY_DN5959_c0_g1_i2.p1  ORF type:complete len:316 (-),score=17.85 TRINITY_DN5959_c0_g1_i2:236-1183(-)